MNLVIDIGNSFYKFSLFDVLSDKKNLFKVAISELEDVLNNIKLNYNVTDILICSVKNKSETDSFIKRLCSYFTCNINLFDPLKYKVLPSKYKDFGQLGCDRWAAILAIYFKKYEDFCIIDCGTAITVDYVINLEHQGGLIGPGLNTLANCLHSRIDNIDSLVQIDSSKVLLYQSKTTSQCIINASKIYFNSFIESVLSENINKYGDKFVTFITGGDNKLFSNNKKYNIQYTENLVLEGLQYILNYELRLKK